jgi:Mn-dependent DtxR family transcriptional regulator
MAQTGSKITPPQTPCSHVSAREATYLLALQELQRETPEPTQVALARAVGVSAPTALEMIKRLRALGLVEPDKLMLTIDGISAALLLASRRHAASVLTRDVLGLDAEAAEIEVDRLAPSLSAEVARRLLAKDKP